jgi:hypothetical protein
MRVARLLAVAGFVVSLGIVGGCSGTESIAPPPPPPPPPAPPPVEIPAPTSVKAAGSEIPANVLSASVIFTLAGAVDSVRVSYLETGGTLQATPVFPGIEGTDTIMVLGLKPSTTYLYQVTVYSGGAAKTSASSTFTTQALPSDLADVRLVKISGSTPRYTATGVQTPGGSYAVIFNGDGEIVWYHSFVTTGLQVSDLMMQPNGNFTAFIGNTSGFNPLPGYYVEVTPAGEEVHTYSAPSGYYMDDHEIRLTGSGASKKAHYFTFDMRDTDLTSIGGNESVQVAGHQIVRENAAGATEFKWDAWDNIGIDEWVGDDGSKANRNPTDFDHPNALSFDQSGNYLVSWRNLDQVVDIDSQTGQVLWRVGGTKGEYTFINDPQDGFRKQHSPKILPNGNLLVYDNGTGSNPQESRAVEYKLDHVAKTATMVWEYRHVPAIYTGFVGWVERLENGSTWVAFALAGRVVEVTPSGAVTWEAQLNVNGANAFVYRLIPISSLYSYVAP